MQTLDKIPHGQAVEVELRQGGPDGVGHPLVATNDLRLPRLTSPRHLHADIADTRTQGPGFPIAIAILFGPVLMTLIPAPTEVLLKLFLQERGEFVLNGPAKMVFERHPDGRWRGRLLGPWGCLSSGFMISSHWRILLGL